MPSMSRMIITRTTTTTNEVDKDDMNIGTTVKDVVVIEADDAFLTDNGNNTAKAVAAAWAASVTPVPEEER